MALEDHELEPATVLHGHVSDDTAYLVDDYPYGYTLRCQIRYWLHTAERGSAAGRVRLMSQTTNPKVAGKRWNKPKASVYYRWAVMTRDARGHVGWWPVGDWGPQPSGHLLMQLQTIHEQLTDEERETYDALLHLARTRFYSGDWQRAATAYAVIHELTADELRDRHGIYLDDRAYAIYAAARAAGLEL
jgi:hypothetical protein